jgi:hypothetical protein
MEWRYFSPITSTIGLFSVFIVGVTSKMLMDYKNDAVPKCYIDSSTGVPSNTAIEGVTEFF